MAKQTHTEYWDPELFKDQGRPNSGAGYLSSNLVLFVILMLVFAFGIYSLEFYPEGAFGLHGAILWCVSVFCMLAPWGIVYHLFSSKTNRAARNNGTELTQR